MPRLGESKWLRCDCRKPAGVFSFKMRYLHLRELRLGVESAAMKACMLAYTFYDADNRVRRYAEALVRRGDQVDAIALAREGQPAFEVILGVRVCRIQKRVINETVTLSSLIQLLLFFIRSAWFLAVRQFS